MKKWISLCGIAVTLFAGTSQAEDIDSFLLFGDSYFDTGAGNAVAASQGIPAPCFPNPIPPFFDNRHSNGPIWIDFVSSDIELGIPNTDYAVAGSTTGTFNVFDPTIGGIQNQIARYAATNTPIPKDQLVIMDGGGNDLFTLPIPPTPADIVAVITQAITNLEEDFLAIQGFGAEKIVMWNLGDQGMLPEFTVLAPPLAPVYTAASAAFNGALDQLVQTFNQFQGEQQIYIFDARLVFNEIIDMLSAEGVNLKEFIYLETSPCVYTQVGPLDAPFADPVHPASFVWQIFSNYMSAYLDTLINGPRFIAAQQDLGYESMRAHQDAVDNHFRTLVLEKYVYCNPCEDYCCQADRFQLYVDGLGKWGKTRSRAGALGTRYNTELGLIGLDYFWSPCMTVGASFSAQHTHGRVKENKGHIDFNDYVPTVYAFLTKDDFYLEADVSYHYFDFKKIKRNIPFLDYQTRGKTHANGVDFQLETGYVSQCGCLTLVPETGLAYKTFAIHPYTESCGSFLDLRLQRQHLTSFTANVGAQVFWSLCDSQITPFAEINYEHEFLRHRHIMGPRIYKANDGAKDYNHVSAESRNFLKFAIGVDAKLASCLTGNISYQGETTFRNYYNNVIRAQLDTSF